MIGLLGGIGPFATSRYYEAIVSAHLRRTGRTPELLILSLAFEHFTALENREDPTDLVAYLNAGIRRLVAGGATSVAMTANSPHVVLDALDSPVPILSILDPVVDEVRARGYRRILLLGIGVTARSPMYPERLAAAGIQTVTPSDAEQEVIDGIVFGELGRGIESDRAREALREIVDRYPTDAVILGCTELPLLLQASDLDRPIVDSLQLHVDDIIAAAESRAGADPVGADAG